LVDAARATHHNLHTGHRTIEFSRDAGLSGSALLRGHCGDLLLQLLDLLERVLLDVEVLLQ
jgi:hypothetical protein